MHTRVRWACLFVNWLNRCCSKNSVGGISTITRRWNKWEYFYHCPKNFIVAAIVTSVDIGPISTVVADFSVPKNTHNLNDLWFFLSYHSHIPTYKNIIKFWGKHFLFYNQIKSDPWSRSKCSGNEVNDITFYKQFSGQTNSVNLLRDYIISINASFKRGILFSCSDSTSNLIYIPS